MNLQQLRYFQTIARLEHYTKAAREHFTSQPALSSAIANLEKELGVQLFEKSGRGVLLTQYGQIFLKYVDSALTEIDNGVKEVNCALRANSGIVRVATSPRLAASVMPEILTQFRDVYPQYRVEMTSNVHKKLIEWLERCEIDFVIGLLSRQLAQNKSLDYRVLFHEDIYLLINQHDSLAYKKEISISDLKDHALIIFDDSTGFKEITLDFFTNCGYIPQVGFEVSDNYTAVSMVQAGLGMAIMGNAKSLDDHGVCKLRLSDEKCKASVCIAWNKIEKNFQSFKDFLNFTVSLYL